MFGNLSLEDNATLAVELWLLAKLCSPQSPDNIDICNKVQNLLEQENTQALALLLVFQNDLKVDLTICDISNVETSFENYYYKELRKPPYERQNQLYNFVSCQTKEKQFELLLSIGNRWWWSNAHFPYFSQLLEKNLFPEIELSILGDRLRLRLLPYLCRRLDRLNALKSWNKKFDKLKILHAKYLSFLMRAIQNPTNNDLDNEARVIESQLSKNINHTWKTEYILAQPSSHFSSIKAWKEFKQKISDVSINDPRWIVKSVDFKSSQNLWACLFFHPDHWSLLVEESLITKEEHDNLVNTQLGDILRIPITPIDILQGIALFSDAPLITPLHKIINVFLSILEKEGIERVSKGRGLDGLLYLRRIQSATIEEVENILYKANNLPSLPSIWVSAILWLCIDMPELNIELLLNFWEKCEHLKPRLSFIHQEELPKNWNNLLERLLDSNRASALRLGIAIAVCSKPNRKVQDTLRERLLAESSSYLINKDNASYELYYRALLNLDPSLEEFSLWVQPEAIHPICKSPWLLDRLSTRFVSATNPKFKLDYEQLRKQLSLFITKRCDYPATIALGALEAILKIDETNLPVLNPKIWQQCPDE